MNSSSKSQQYNDYSYNILMSLKMKSNKSLFPLVCRFRKRTPVLVGRGTFWGVRTMTQEENQHRSPVV